MNVFLTVFLVVYGLVAALIASALFAADKGVADAQTKSPACIRGENSDKGGASDASCPYAVGRCAIGCALQENSSGTQDRTSAELDIESLVPPATQDSEQVSSASGQATRTAQRAGKSLEYRADAVLGYRMVMTLTLLVAGFFPMTMGVTYILQATYLGGGWWAGWCFLWIVVRLCELFIEFMIGWCIFEAQLWLGVHLRVYDPESQWGRHAEWLSGGCSESSPDPEP